MILDQTGDYYHLLQHERQQSDTSFSCVHFFAGQVMTKWEASGNGTGQRGIDEETFGHWTTEHEAQALVDGDKRANFVALHMGQRFHHLYLWVLLDRAGIMNLVLTRLSPEVAMDCDNIHTDTAQVQRRRRKKNEDDAERQQKRTFQLRVGEALQSVARTSEMDSKMTLMLGMINSVVQDLAHKEEKQAKDETVVLDLRVKALKATVAGVPELASIYNEHLAHHQERISKTEAEIVELKDKLEDLRLEYRGTQADYDRAHDNTGEDSENDEADSNESN